MGVSQVQASSLVAITTFNASGTFTKNPRTKSMFIKIQGGGGAGGGVGPGSLTHGGPGRAGQLVEMYYPSAINASVTVGAGGVGVSGADGGAGGTSSFFLTNAAGGAAGKMSVTSNGPQMPGLGLGGAWPLASNLNGNGNSAPANTGAGGSGAYNSLGSVQIGGNGGSGYVTVWEFA